MEPSNDSSANLQIHNHWSRLPKLEVSNIQLKIYNLKNLVLKEKVR